MRWRKYPVTAEQDFLTGKRSGCKDSKGCTLSTPLVQHRTQHCEPSLSGNSATVSGTEIISSNNKLPITAATACLHNGHYGTADSAWTTSNSKEESGNSGTDRGRNGNTLKEEITKLFLQILYADESVNINKGTLEVSKATYERAKELLIRVVFRKQI